MVVCLLRCQDRLQAGENLEEGNPRVSLVLLYRLQQLDLAAAEASARRSGLDDGTGLRASIAEAEDRLDVMSGDIAASRSRARALELELAAVEGKRAKVESDLYSGRIGNPKELSAMQEEVHALDRQRASLEDALLVELERVDEMEPAALAVQRSLDEARMGLAEREASYVEEIAAADRQLAHLKAQREALAPEIDEALLRRYERLREGKGGIVVTTVRSGICDGCHVAVPEGTSQRVLQDPGAHATCEGCGRLLVAPEHL